MKFLTGRNSNMKAKKCYWAAFAVPLVICVIICIGNGVFPFGEKCILEMDMYHQYCPFFNELQEKLLHGGSLQYSWNLGLGSDFVGLYAYYLASPLNWLVVLWPKSYIIEFMTLLILVKIAFSGTSFFLFLTDHFQLKDEKKEISSKNFWVGIVFSTAYALSGFVAAYSWDIMWMDSIALAPLIFLGLEKLVKQKDPRLYYITLALSIVANYYISIMICIFLVFYFILLFFEQKGGKIKAVGRFAFYSLLAGGTGAILIIPEAMLLGSSGSAVELPEKMEWYFNIIEEISRVCTMTETYTGRDHWPNLYAGAFTLVLLGLYVLNRKISWKKKIPRIAMVVFFLISFTNNYLEFFWHGFDFPDSLPARQSFLFIFLLLVMAFDQVMHWEGTKVWHIPVVWLGWGALLGASWFITEDGVTDELSFVITGLFLLFYGIVFLMLRLGKARVKDIFFKAIVFVTLVELGVNMAYSGFSCTSRTAYMEKMEDYLVLIDHANEITENNVGLNRIEDAGRKTKNDSALYGYQSSTIFSSMMNIGVSRLYQKVYMEGGKNYYCYNGATPLTTAMLSVNYVLSDDPDLDNPYYQFVSSSGEHYLYKTTYSLPLGYVMSEEAIENWNPESNTRINNMNDLAYLLGAETKMFTQVKSEQTAKEGETTFVIPEDGYYYMGYDYCDSESLNLTSTERKEIKYSKTSHRYLMEIRECVAGEEITVKNKTNEIINYTLYTLEESAVAAAVETLSKQCMTMESCTDTEIVGSITVTEQGRLIFSIPHDSGWTLYVNGEETEIDPFYEAFIGVHLEEGEYEIRLKYETPGLGMGAVISISCILIFILTLVIRHLIKKRKEVRHVEEDDQYYHSLL